MGELATLLDLAAIIRGEPPPEVDWRAAVDLANRAFVTPSLAGRVDAAPPEIQAFVADVSARNAERNRRLRRQLEEVVQALDRGGVGCTLLKGARQLADADRAGARLMSDLDLQVAPRDAPAALDALARAGFKVHQTYPFDDSHVAAELFRDSDVGMVDLHRRAPGPRHLATSAELNGRIRRAVIGGVEVGVPATELQVLQLALHDQFHDGDYWSGVFDLRHLIDTAALTREPLDWSLFDSPVLTALTRRVVRRQLFAAARLFGAAVPPALLSDPATALDYRRSCLRLAWPALHWPLAAGALVAAAPAALSHYRREARWRANFTTPTPRRERRLGRLTRLRVAFAAADGSKV